MDQTIDIVVRGKVQGVYFRQTAVRQAQILGITGTAQNTADGSVFLVATGSAEQLRVFVAWCGTGPSHAEVQSVVTHARPLQRFTEFTIER